MTVRFFRKTSARLARFQDEAHGSVNVEALLLLPLLIVTMAVSMVFYDAFRQDSLGEKATYTLGDMLSRETNYITADYVDSAKFLFDVLTGAPEGETSVRVSVVSYDGEDDAYRLEWSQVRGLHVPLLTEADVASQTAQLPVMVSGEQLILVETYIDYDWPLNLGYDDGVLTARAFTRPRFAPQLVWQGS